MFDAIAAHAGKTILGYRAWNAIRNAGDAMMPHLIELLSGAAPYYAPAGQPHLLGVGSILFMANPHSLIWGAGSLGPHVPIPPLSHGQIRAVRGAKTAAAFAAQGVVLDDVPHGDPGIFAAEILARNPYPNPAKRRIAVVPHHASLNHPFFRGLANSTEIQLVNICDDTMLPLQQIADAEIVVSQSLHGLIFAESFGKPAIWIGDPNDGEFAYKVSDWFSTMENPQAKPAALGTSLDELLPRAERQFSRIDKQALADSFPATLATPPAGHLIGFRACRAHSPFVFFVESAHPLGPGAFFNLAKSQGDKFLQNWSERPYLLAVDANRGVLPAPAQLRVIAATMDAMFRTDYAIIAAAAELETHGSGARLAEGVTRFDTAPAAIGAMLLRPMYERPAASHAVFGV